MFNIAPSKFSLSLASSSLELSLTLAVSYASIKLILRLFLFCRWAKSWSNWISLLEASRTICPIRRHPRRERPVFGLVGCLDAGRLLIYWDWSCCCKYSRRFSSIELDPIDCINNTRSLLVKLKILNVPSQGPLNEYTFVSCLAVSCFLVFFFFTLTQGILLFYIGGTLIIGLLVPSNDPGLNLSSGTAASSPFVIAIKEAGIKSLPSVWAWLWRK